MKKNFDEAPALALDLSRLRADGSQAVVNGFSAIQVKSIALCSPDTRLKIDCTVLASNEPYSITELLRQHFPGDNPLARGWLVAAVSLNVYYPPARGSERAKVESVEVTSEGELNLDRFDAHLQEQVEGYLVSLGVLRPGHGLTASANQQRFNIASGES